MNGAKASDIPFAQPTKMGLTLNLCTARALGLTVSPDLLMRADQVLQ